VTETEEELKSEAESTSAVSNLDFGVGTADKPRETSGLASIVTLNLSLDAALDCGGRFKLLKNSRLALAAVSPQRWRGINCQRCQTGRRAWLGNLVCWLLSYLVDGLLDLPKNVRSELRAERVYLRKGKTLGCCHIARRQPVKHEGGHILSALFASTQRFGTGNEFTHHLFDNIFHVIV
jgi:hypothetical protein